LLVSHQVHHPRVLLQHQTDRQDRLDQKEVQQQQQQSNKVMWIDEHRQEHEVLVVAVVVNHLRHHHVELNVHPTLSEHCMG